MRAAAASKDDNEDDSLVISFRERERIREILEGSDGGVRKNVCTDIQYNQFDHHRHRISDAMLLRLSR